MLLARRNADAQDNAMIRDQQMHFGAEAPTRVTQRMSRWLFKLRRKLAAETGHLVRILFRSTRGTAGADNGGIDKPQVVPQAAALLQVLQKKGENFGQGAIAAPAAEAAIDGLPGTIALRDVPPRRTGVQAPQDAIEEPPVVLQGASTATVVDPVREERRDALPLWPRKFVAMAHRRPPRGNLRYRKAESAVMYEKLIFKTVPSRDQDHDTAARR